MTEAAKTVPSLHQLLDGYPKNWGRWGSEDEVGALNYLGPQHVLDAVRLVRSGKVFTLQVPMADPKGDQIGRAHV